MPLTLQILAIPFSGHEPGGPAGLDRDGEYFSPHTETMLELYQRVPLVWHHGRDGTVGKRTIGHAENFRQTTEGWWCDAVVNDTNPRLVERIRRLADSGELFASSGSVSHLVQKDGQHILNWPVGELSLTPSPANLHAVAIADGLLEGRREILLNGVASLETRLQALQAVGPHDARRRRLQALTNATLLQLEAIRV
jgi:hypothetical protein